MLRRLLNIPSGPLWQTPIEPTTKPETERIAINVDESLQTAYDSRAELKTQDLQLALAKLNSSTSATCSSPTWPSRPNTATTAPRPLFTDAFNQVTGLNFNTWQISLILTYPIQNRAARAQSAIANLDLDRFKLLYDSEKTVVATEVRTAARGVETAAKQIDAARKSTEYQEKNLDAERKRYENGMSTSFNITTIQDQLTQARSVQVQAIVGLSYGAHRVLSVDRQAAVPGWDLDRRSRGPEPEPLQPAPEPRCRGEIKPWPMEDSSFGRLLGAIVSPGKTFRSIAERPTWAAALLVLLVASGAVAYVVGLRTDYRDVIVQSVKEKGAGHPGSPARAPDQHDAEGGAGDLGGDGADRHRPGLAARGAPLLGSSSSCWEPISATSRASR